jgi:hypothetical protein
MGSEASAIWAATAATIAVQLLIAAYLMGKLMGRLRLIEYRLDQVEAAMKRLGFTFTVKPRDARV